MWPVPERSPSDEEVPSLHAARKVCVCCCSGEGMHSTGPRTLTLSGGSRSASAMWPATTSESCRWGPGHGMLAMCGKFQIA